MSRITLSQGYCQGLAEEMYRDDSIFVIGTDLYERGGHWAQVSGLGDKFGRNRVRNTPISEAAMVATGVGAAMAGLRPVIDLNFIDFCFGAMDEIVNQVAKIRYMWDRPVPVIIRGTFGISGGGAQHSNLIESWFTHTPGLLVAAPSTPYDAKGLIKTALRCEDPVIFLMHKMLTGFRGEVGGNDVLVPFGSGVVRREGDDVTIVSYGAMAHQAAKAAGILEDKGIGAEVIDLRTLFPIDLELIETSVRKTRHLVLATEAPRHGSIAAEIAAEISESMYVELDAPVLRVGGAHAPVPHSPALLNSFPPDHSDIVRSVLECVGEGAFLRST